MKVNATFFGKTRNVEAELWYNNQKLDASEVAIEEEILWVERGEDWYALMSPQLRNKVVAVVTREAWLAAEEDWVNKSPSTAMQIRQTYNAVDYKALLIKVLNHETDIEWLLLQSGWSDEEKAVLRELGPKESEY